MQAIVDVRPERDFEAGHLPGSANVPLEELHARTHELPPAKEPLWVIDRTPTRASEAVKFLSLRGHSATVIAWDPNLAVASGPASVRLWQPNHFLVEALERIASDEVRNGLALDVACGSGRDAVFLALRGFNVEAIDVLPDALSRAQDLARRSGVSIRTGVQDLDRDPTLPKGQCHLVVVFRFLQRSLFSALRDAIRPGGYMIYETFHELNAKTGRKPQNPAHLLSNGELARAFEGFDMLILREAHERDGRFFSSVMARKPRG